MLRLLLLTIVSVTWVAAAEEPEGAESAIPIRVHEDEERYSFADGLEVIRHRERAHRPHHHIHDDRRPHQTYRTVDEPSGPVVFRSNPHRRVEDGHPNIEEQNRIISHVYSPDFYQPTWTLDYRYLKTGGRDYTRGPGGQILILPKGIHTNEKKEFSDFDSLLEHLRLTRLSEQQDRYKSHGAREQNVHDDHSSRDRNNFDHSPRH